MPEALSRHRDKSPALGSPLGTLARMTVYPDSDEAPAVAKQIAEERGG
jgi:hypothetical protein